MRLAYEALSWGTRVRDARDAWDVVTRVDHPDVGLLLDSYHFFVRDNPLDDLDRIDGDRVFLVQLADAPRFVMDTIRHSRHFRLFPGQGDHDVVEFVRRITARGFDGWLSHEVFNDEFRAAPPLQTALDGYRSLVWLDEQLSSHQPDPLGPISLVEVVGREADAIGDLLERAGAELTHTGTGPRARALRWGDAHVVIEPGASDHEMATVAMLGISPPQSVMERLVRRASTYRGPGCSPRPRRRRRRRHAGSARAVRPSRRWRSAEDRLPAGGGDLGRTGGAPRFLDAPAGPRGRRGRGAATALDTVTDTSSWSVDRGAESRLAVRRSYAGCVPTSRDDARA